METTAIANRLVELLKQGKFEEAQKELYGQEVESSEPIASKIPKMQGLETILSKGKQFRESVESWHRMEVSHPIIATDYFSIALKIELTYKGQEHPTTLDEIILYQVSDGKIVQEQFFY